VLDGRHVSLLELARFGASDDPIIVEASFCCPYCLERPNGIELSDDFGEEGAAAACWCERCDAVWTVALTAVQSMRMRLAPPPGLPVGHS
jgi:hypothetical protein